MRRGLHPKGAGPEQLRRFEANTVERRLLNARGLPNFNIRLFVVNAGGESTGLAMCTPGESTYAVCTDNSTEKRPLEPLGEEA